MLLFYSLYVVTYLLMAAFDWQDDNNNNGDDEEEGSAKEDAVEMDDQSSMSEEMPAISLPGHTAPPINYEGPEFPVPEVQPLPRSPAVQQSSDEMALRIKRADVLQTEVIDWLAYTYSI